VEGKEVDPRSDVYSLGVILYEMITGRLPFEGDTPFTIGVKHKSEIPQNPKEFNAQMPDELGGLILRCLEKDKQARYQTAGDLLADLNNIEKGMPVTQKVVPQKRPLTSREITLKFDLKTMIIPLLTGMVLIVLAWFFFFRGKGTAIDPNLVLVTVFDNQTGIPSLNPQGRVAADSLTEGIAQIEGLEVIPVSAVPESSQKKETETGGIQNLAQIQDLTKKTGAGIVITGTYYMAGKDIQFNAKITDTQTGKLISSVTSDLGLIDNEEGGMLPYIKIIHNLRQRVMGVLAARRDPYVAESLSLNPPTYDAYQEFRSGMEYFARSYDQSIQHFQKAFELDPTFVYPLQSISIIHHNRHDYEESKAVADQIQQMRDHLNEFDRFMLDYRLADLNGNYQKALSVLRQAEKRFPNSWWVRDTIGLLGRFLNRPQEAVESLSKIDFEATSKMTSVTSSWSIGRMIRAYHMLGDYEKERETIEKAKGLFPDSVWRFHEVRVSAALGELEEVERFVDESLEGLSIAGSPLSVLFEAVQELRLHGYMDEAQNVADRLADWAQKQMPADPSESQLRGFGDCLYLSQRWDDAEKIYKELGDSYPDSYYHVNYVANLGCIAARTGNKDEAVRISEELASIDRPYMFGRPTYRRARIASLLGEKQQAVDLLHQSMREGFEYSIEVKQDMDFLPLKDFPPFQEFIKPKG
jgi:tetratricopeptide (TPR) repeat protein